MPKLPELVPALDIIAQDRNLHVENTAARSRIIVRPYLGALLSIQADRTLMKEMSLQEDIVEQVYNSLSSDLPDLDSLQTYLENGFNLVSRDTQKLIYQLTARINDSLFPPLTKLELVHTEGCNIACSYCFEKRIRGQRQMPSNIAKAAIDVLFDYSRKEQKLHITHFGGEPLLNFHSIRYSTEYAEAKASSLGKTVDFGMTTNGILLNEVMVDYFARHNTRVLLSIDGLESTHDGFRKDKRGHGTFKRVKKGFEILKRKQPWVGTKMTVMPSTASNLFENVTGLYEMGINQFIIGYATGVKWSRESMETYVRQLERIFQWYRQTNRNDLRISEFDDCLIDETFFGCQAGRNSISVNVNGEISPCSKMLALNDRSLLMKLGDVKHGLTCLKNRSELMNCLKLRKACKAQGIDKGFKGGCFASNYEDNADVFLPSMQDYAFSKLNESVCSNRHHAGTDQSAVNIPSSPSRLTGA